MKIFEMVGEVAVNAREAKGQLKSIDDKGAKTSRNLTKNFKRAGRRIGRYLKRGAQVGAVAIGALATQSIRQMTKFQEETAEAFTLIPGASQEMKENLIQDVQDVGEEYGQQTEEMTGALYQALSAGVEPENIEGFLETSAKAATAGVTDIETSVDALTTVVNAYGKEAVDFQEASDVIFTTIKEGKVTFPELGTSMGKVVPKAAELGVEFKDLGAALAQMTKQGIQSREATTYLRAMLVQLAKEGTDASDAFKEMTGKTIPDFLAEGNNLADVLEVINEYAQENGKSFGQMWTNVRAGTSALTLGGQNLNDFREIIDETGNSAGATGEAYETMADTIQHRLDKLRAWWQNVQINIGGKIEKDLADLLDWLKAHQGEIEGMLTGMFEGLIDGSKWLVNNKGRVVSAVKGIGVAFASWKIAALTGNLWGLAAALTAVTGIAISDYIKDMKKYGDFRGKVGESFKDAQQTWSNLNDIQKRTLSDYRSVLETLQSVQEENVNLTEDEIDRLEKQKEFLRSRLEALGVTETVVKKFTDTEEEFAEELSDTDRALAGNQNTLDDLEEKYGSAEGSALSFKDGVGQVESEVSDLNEELKDEKSLLDKARKAAKALADRRRERTGAVNQSRRALAEERRAVKRLGEEERSLDQLRSSSLRRISEVRQEGKDAAEELKVSWEGFSDDLSNNLSSTLTDLLTDFENFGDHISSFFENLTRNVISRYTDVWADKIVNATTSGNFGGGGGGGGGIDWGSLIQTGVNLFASAQEGAVTTGETIVKAGDNPSGQELLMPLEESTFAQLANSITKSMKRQGGGGDIGEVHVYNVEGMSDKAFVDGVQRNSDSVKAQILDAISNNEALRNQLRRKLS